jgi:anti-anti-sigma regulatory factor
VGIFSLFGKKDRQQVPSPADKDSSRKKREEASNRTGSTNTDAARSQIVQRKAAQATAMKIDAIESEMSSEFVRPVPTGNTLPGPPPPASPQAKVPAKTRTPPSAKSKAAPLAAPSTLGELTMGETTQFLLSSETISGNVMVSESETTPVIEEAAILFANDQIEMAEQVLQSALLEETSHATSTVWAMLFDLYQITGKRVQFDNLSIDFANKFETSPPAWIETATESAEPAPLVGATPTVPFIGKLDGSITKQLERTQNLAGNNRVLRLEFARVTEVDPVGCGILLSVLKKLQKSGHDLILVGALELSTKIRAILEVGRRDETEAPWLLLLEILQLLNLEKEFEEASIDYCVTFEVSPPAFAAPKNKVTTALEENIAAKPDSEYFMMPAVIEGRTDQLILSIVKYAANRNPAILDCSDLTRVDFGAAGQLLTGLTPLVVRGAVFELHNVNHLVAALFNVMGLKDLLRILPHKN